MKQQGELDPEGKPIGREMRPVQQDEVTETSSGIVPTSPSPLTGKPAGLKLDEVDDPGAVNAPRIAVQATKGEGKNTVKECVPSVVSRLPETISAREIADDGASYTDGRCGNVGTGAR